MSTHEDAEWVSDEPEIDAALTEELVEFSAALKHVAGDPNLGLLIVAWEMRQLIATPLPDGRGFTNPPLLVVIQRWLRAGCPAISFGPDPLLELGLIHDGEV